MSKQSGSPSSIRDRMKGTRETGATNCSSKTSAASGAAAPLPRGGRAPPVSGHAYYVLAFVRVLASAASRARGVEPVVRPSDVPSRRRVNAIQLRHLGMNRETPVSHRRNGVGGGNRAPG